MKIVNKELFMKMIESDNFMEVIRELKNREAIKNQVPTTAGIEVSDKDLDLLEKLSKTKDSKEVENILEDLGLDLSNNKDIEKVAARIEEYLENDDEDDLNLDEDCLNLVSGGIDPFYTGLVVLIGGAAFVGGVTRFAWKKISSKIAKKKKDK